MLSCEYPHSMQYGKYSSAVYKIISFGCMPYMSHCSSTNALTGEGLEEAVDWLTGKEFP